MEISRISKQVLTGTFLQRREGELSVLEGLYQYRYPLVPGEKTRFFTTTGTVREDWISVPIST